MKTHRHALLLAATLLAVPALVSAHGGRGSMMDDNAGERMGPDHMMGEYAQEHMGPGHHEWGHHGKRHSGMKQMDPAHFEQRMTQRMAKMGSPELKAQFIATQQARLAMMEQNQKLHRLMAEDSANAIDNTELKAATLEKIAADDQLKQQKLRLMREALGKLEN
ncbi:hypothetical protein Q9290_15350 [Oceanimonas sp. CHS3-5]|uniref:hypothetical protein n=1 Tax=Oceanimonas sp. CHS3-5 TaxID=3068186 RepID=UPI00273DC84E|nr:hypothetical protein [Oceanimonas sp. CHS3-5]MDP5293655.1 hypothetical protein [Oceanimonas sp. CHS3-5]